MNVKLTSFGAALLTATLFGGMSPAMAQGMNTPAVERAQQEINGRIQQGLRSGAITPSEAQNLLRRAREIDTRENRYKSDGRATAQERQMLRRDLDGLSAEVERKIANARFVKPNPDASTPGVDARQYDIRARIADGVRSGRLNAREAQRLQSRHRDIARTEARFKADGVISRQERGQLRAALATLRADVERRLARRGR